MKYVSYGMVIVGALALGGCSTTITPPMQMAHTAVVSKTYTNMGTMQINTFEDRRPQSQQEAHSLSGADVPFSNGVIYSGNSLPTMPVYLQQVITEEAKRSGIFTITSHSPQYVMDGYITSMEAMYKTEPINLPVTLNGNSTPVTLGGNPSFIAKVDYHVDIYHDGQKIFAQDFSKTEKMPNYGDGDTTPSSVISGQAETLLDQAVTESVQDLFTSIVAQGLAG